MEVILLPNKREKFIELAEKRVNNALKQIELIGNLSNTSAYEYNEDDVQTIINTLKTSLKEMEAKFNTIGKKGKRFTLKK